MRELKMTKHIDQQSLEFKLWLFEERKLLLSAAENCKTMKIVAVAATQLQHVHLELRPHPASSYSVSLRRLQM
jgi:hypothetical protein